MSDVAASPQESRWGLAQGDPVAPDISAIRLLGGGLRYEAYLAWDDRLMSLVVVKVVRPALVEDDRTLAGLAAEVELLSRLHHPVLVRHFGAALGGPRPHVVLEHLEGPRLSTLLRKSGPLGAEQLLPLGVQLCAAAHYLAGAGVAHLDIKASNIIMGAPARLIDLSVARTLEECARLRSPVGTDAYMAPEQCLPAAAGVGAAADVWGIGVTLYEAATGRRPFSRGDADAEAPEARWPQLAERPKPPERMSEPLAAAVLACLSPEPGDRPAPAELLAELEGALAGLPKPWVAKLKPRPRRR